MIKLHKNDYVPKYNSGKWFWNDRLEKFDFLHYYDLEYANEEYIDTNGIKFRKTLNQIEELAFRQEFARPVHLTDGDVILINDIRDLVLFTMPATLLRQDFITFCFTKEVHRFWHALIIYFEYYLKMVEFVLIRRDEIAGDKTAQIQSTESTEYKRIFSMHLSQYRLLLAREYSIILLGEGNMKRYYHIKPVLNISMTIKDSRFFEHFLAVSTQIVWIAMHRRAYGVIDMEMARLFRTEHFKMYHVDHMKFTKAEAALLYGKNYKRVNYRWQNSPLIFELTSVPNVDLPILWIGKRKYRGTDKRIAALEVEYITPDSQLALVDISHGILGHPKKLYNTIFQINWEAVRFMNYNERDDPYKIIRQPALKIPDLNEIQTRKFSENYRHYLSITINHTEINKKLLRKWLNRDTYVKTIVLTNVTTRADKELQMSTKKEFADQVLTRYNTSKMAKLKSKSNLSLAALGSLKKKISILSVHQ